MPSLFDPTDYDEDIKAGPELSDIWKSVKDAWGGMNNWERTSVASSVMPPVIGDVVGVGADIGNMIDNPEARTWSNGLWTLAGALPGIPSGLGWIKTQKAKNLSKADKADLRNAKKLIGDGADRRTLFNETGWELGPELQPYKYETDYGVDFYPWDLAEGSKAHDTGQMGEGLFGTLGEVYDHPELYGAYPGLEKTPINIWRDSHPVYPLRGGSYSPSRNELNIYNLGHPSPDNFYDAKYVNRDIKKIVDHEVSHASAPRSGMQRGGSPSVLAAQNPNMLTPKMHEFNKLNDAALSMQDAWRQMNPDKFELIKQNEMRLLNDYNAKVADVANIKTNDFGKAAIIEGLTDDYNKQVKAMRHGIAPDYAKMVDEQQQLWELAPQEIELTGRGMYDRLHSEQLAEANAKMGQKAPKNLPMFDFFDIENAENLLYYGPDGKLRYMKENKHMPSLFD